MPKPLAKGLPTSRYSYADAVAEVSRVLGEEKRGIYARCAAACLLRPDQFSKRLRISDDRESGFQVEHFGAIADVLGAPAGWPFVRWEVAEARQAPVKRSLGKSAPKD